MSLKKLLRYFYLFIFASTTVFSSQTNYNLNPVTNDGFEMMRKAKFLHNTDSAGISGSIQNINFFTGRDKYTSSKGIALGTASNFVKIPNWYSGVTVSYEKYKEKETNFRTRNYSFGVYSLYDYKNNIFIGGINYSQEKGLRSKEFTQALEYGKFLKVNNYVYAGLKNYKKNYKDYENYNFLNTKLGLTRYDNFDKFLFENNLELNLDNKEFLKERRKKVNLEFYSKVSYKLYNDLTVNLKYKGIKNQKFYNDMLILGFTHTF